jgi:uncharacterized protein YaiL (DUF2058 family)
MRHNNVKTVGRATLEDNHQPLGPHTGLSRAHGCTSKKAWHRRRTHDRKRTVAKKNATRNRHKVSVET